MMMLCLLNFRYTFLLLLFVHNLSSLIVHGRTTSVDVKVTLRGKKYTVRNVRTVRELQLEIEGQSGVVPGKQGRLLFGGKRLKLSDILNDVGIVDGSVVNVVPTSKTHKSSTTVKNSNRRESNAQKNSVDTSPGPSGNTSARYIGNNSIETMFQRSGINSNTLEALNKYLPLGSDGKVPDLHESIKLIQEMMNNPEFQNYLNDPVKLEESRNMILNQPMIRHMMESFPGFMDILDDPVKWKETMIAAANMYKVMGGSNMMDPMSNIVSGMFGISNDHLGSFGGVPDLDLDELSEGDDY